MKNLTRNTLVGLMLASAAVLATVDVAAARGQGGQGGPGGPGAFRAMEFVEIDSDGNGVVTLEELQALGDARFAAADSDGSGALDKSEVIQMMTEGMEKRAAAAEAKGQDGQNRQGRGQQGAPDEARLAWMADGMILRLDTDGDGLVTAAEMQIPTEKLERMIDRFDTDDDNAVSEAEFDAAKGGRRGHGRP
ncbi:MAG: hypothetical protein GY945_01920 [Rhodobacteraceae bacterium]|nr:hypothetical protein [Paracoccaceae bacterium]